MKASTGFRGQKGENKECIRTIVVIFAPVTAAVTGCGTVRECNKDE